jgi:hypothetical protein
MAAASIHLHSAYAIAVLYQASCQLITVVVVLKLFSYWMKLLDFWMSSVFTMSCYIPPTKVNAPIDLLITNKALVVCIKSIVW